MLAKLAQAGSTLETAQSAVILVHGRGATAESIISLADEITPRDAGQTKPIAFLAPQAPGMTWYPYSFLAPLEQNEPYLTQALHTLADLFEQLEQNHLPPERVALVGFSQGACLSLEFAARYPQRYGGIAGLSGGLIGPPGTTWNNIGSLDGTPVFLGCSDVDPHIPEVRVHETTRALAHFGAQVIERIYPGMAHTVNEDEIEFVRGMIGKIK